MQTKAEEELPAYYKIAELEMSLADASQAVYSALAEYGFDVLGKYPPENNRDFEVIAFTRTDLQKICLIQEDRGALASVLKVALHAKGGQVIVSILNPMYLFYAYLGGNADKSKSELMVIENDVRQAMSLIGSDFTSFGGSMGPNDLKDYHFMAMMPRFDDPVGLNEFPSFEKGVDIIRNNLKSGKGNTTKVYELIFPEKDIAIFGVGLGDPETGEAYFLPIIGEDHIAAMPYEIILQGTEVTMLHGKYRFALHWPELTMGEFMKIMSTPGDVEETLEELTK